jgi:hypothetical protein
VIGALILLAVLARPRAAHTRAARVPQAVPSVKAQAEHDFCGWKGGTAVVPALTQRYHRATVSYPRKQPNVSKEESQTRPYQG